ncbi:MAG TPA: SDR family oxidoreductase [Candidatus Acidoferrales bacterium]|nr:SDR family oxidoreductase [Candidatus Acidoferrales bacterium]
MRIIVTGGSGMLGHCLVESARHRHEVWGSYRTHPVDIRGCTMFTLDVTDETQVKSQFSMIRPDVVIHTAGLTDVDECERSPDKAKAINSKGTKSAAKIAGQLGALFVYISSDYVFDGAKGNYSEKDTPRPVNHYGRSKLLGEEGARQACSKLLVLRTTMFGLKVPPQTGMMEGLVAALRGGKPVTRFVDQFFTPLYTQPLSDFIIHFAELGLTGVFHLGAVEKVSRFEFAQQVAEIFAPATSEIRPVPFRQVEGMATRPRDTSLTSRMLVERTGIELPAVRAGLLQLQKDWQMMGEEVAAV